MKDRRFIRPFLAALAAMLILASCASDEESATADTTTTVAPEATDEATAEPEADEERETDEADEPAEPEAPTTTVDDRTDLEIATDNLDVTAFQLGVEDLEGAANCVIERLDSEGIEFTGEGTAELIALIRCEPDAINQWLPTTNPVLGGGEEWSCTVGSIGDWLSARSIPEAEEFLSAGTPPQEFFEQAASTCNLNVDDVAAALS